MGGSASKRPALAEPVADQAVRNPISAPGRRAPARLQTIPDSFDFGGNSAADIGGMIGDAVPVDLA